MSSDRPPQATAPGAAGVRVAVVRLSSLGDVTLASAVVDALRESARVAFVTRAEFAPLYRDDPRLESLVAYRRGEPEAAGAALAAFRPDWIVDLQGSIRSRQLTRAIGAPKLRVQKATLRRRLALVGISRGLSTRVYERFLRVLEDLPFATRAATPSLHVSTHALRSAREVLPAETIGIGLVPGAAWANKRWPLDRWSALARAILLESPAAHLSVFLGPGERELGEQIREALADDARISLVEAPLAELPARLCVQRVVVTGDSGPMHVAEAVGTPVVALFGPTTRAFGFAPFLEESRVVERRLACRPCHVHGGERCPLKHHRCMRDIRVTDIIEEIRPHVERPGLDATHGSPLSSEGG